MAFAPNSASKWDGAESEAPILGIGRRSAGSDDTRFDCLHGALFRAKVASIAALVQPDSHPTPAAPRREKAGKGVFTFPRQGSGPRMLDSRKNGL